MDNNEDNETFNEGLILPKVLSQLNIILDQYPDDTHIFKELIQNAEDAGASTVKFLYDRNHYGANRKQLLHQDFADFQGPALYAYNNGVFTEDDWKGLRMVSESVKQKDPFKVGYFGMGFKSVFHITDLPSVISGNKLAYIDPQQRLFNATSHAWNLEKHPELLTDYRHQVEPYLNVFDCTQETFQQGYYDSTLFRFPLRRVPSLINKRPYDHEKMKYVMENFKNEAHLLPIFLKHLEKVEIYEKAQRETEPRLTYSMSIDNSCLKEVRHKRKEFMLKTKSAESKTKIIMTTFKLLIETKWYSHSNKCSKNYHKYLVTLYYSEAQASISFNKLLKDPDIHYLPWVGVAMSLNERQPEDQYTQSNESIENDGMKNRNDDKSNGVDEENYFKLTQEDGRIFCFLPLPMEQGYSTGLPVFINGFFALEQNRKHLKWPESFNIRNREEMMDKQVLWNVCLLKEVLPKCYTQLVIEAIKLSSSNIMSDSYEDKESSFKISDKMIYRMFPNSECIDQRWEEILFPLYSELMKHPIVFTKANGGTWIEPKFAVFNKITSNETVSNLITNILLEDSVRVVSPPSHVITAIRKYSRSSVLEVGPSLVSKTCRSLQSSRSSIFKRFSKSDKIELLKYFVLQNKFDSLDGLELLPLNDGTFHYFYYSPWKADRPIYILKDLEMMKLLPGVDKDLLSVEIDDEIKHVLMKASMKGFTQLKIMDVHTLKLLIPKCFPIKWRSKMASSGDLISWTPGNIGQPQEEWLEFLWNFLSQNSPRDLSSVEKLPILPVRTVIHNNGSKTIDLLPLLDLSKIKLLVNDQGQKLGVEIQKVAEKIGIVVVEDLPEFVKQHSQVTRHYLYLPSYIGVTKAFHRLCELQGISSVVKKLKFETTIEDKRNLRDLFSKLSHHEMHRNINILFRDLPLFETVQSKGRNKDQIEFISFNECQVAAPFEKIDFPLSSPLLDISDVSSQALGKLLGVRQLNSTQLLEEVVFRDIEGAYYESTQVKEVMMHVLKNFHRLVDSESSTLKKSLQYLPFMENNDLLVPISHYYDPEQDLLKRLFVLEKRFPDKDYSKKGFLPILREIGLKGISEVEPEDLKESAEVISVLSGNMTYDINNNETSSVKNLPGKVSVEILMDKSAAVVEFLHKFTPKLNDDCIQESLKLSDALKNIFWVTISSEKPPFYPKTLAWYGSRVTSVPSNDESFMKRHFEKPINMISKKHYNLAGSIKPVPYLDFSSDVEESLVLDIVPDINTIIKHLKNVVTSYSAYEKVVYSEISRSIYVELSKHEPEEVKKVMCEENLPDDWIWNGEGFVSKDKVVFNATFMDLRPFVYSMPLEMGLMMNFFEKVADIQKNCNLISVIKNIYNKHELSRETDLSNDLTNTMNNENKETKACCFSTSEVRKDLHLCVSVLNELKSHIHSMERKEKKIEFLKLLHDNLYLPIHSEDTSRLTMALLADCTFCDEEWLRQGYNMEDFGIEDNEDGSKISLVHPNVPIGTSEALGVPTLMSRMLDAEELDISYGQSDSLTHRLNSLLLEYSDGFAIPKELVQNADDAGATQVSFLYDERDNDDAKTCLLDEGMKECQGPALWVHNDAVFTDSDFDNITKLNGATKLNQPDKIGKFGLGFNSVYNITDVPSFVSRHSIVIFDPHTYHLGKSIRDKRKPGIKINLQRHKKNLKRFGNQFKPYNGIFNCNLKSTSQLELYNGTLFRFPLRSRYQAAKSEISSKHYDDREIRELLKILFNSASKLLLFSQNVLKIKIFHLPKKGNPLTDVVEIYSIEKNLIKIIREIPACLNEMIHSEKNLPEKALELLKQCCSLKAGVEITKRHRNKISSETIPTLDSSFILSMNTMFSNSSKSEHFFETNHSQLINNSQKWLICNFLGVNESLKMALTEENLTSNVSIAASIEGNDQCGYKPVPIVNESGHYSEVSKDYHCGLIFTFMPLPLKSGLPVHINGAFAVTSNRKLLCQKSEDDKFDMRPVWNKILMEDALSEAYLKLLNDLSILTKPGNIYSFSTIWPNLNFSSPSVEYMVKNFYNIMTTTNNYAILSDECSWKTFKNSMFVDFELSKTEIGKVSYEVFSALNKNVLSEDKIVVYFDDWVEQTMVYSEIKLDEFSNNYNIVRFFKEIFFPNIVHIDSEQRDILLLYALSLQLEELNELISNCNCIPVTPYGEQLKSVKDLIDPTSILARMYSGIDEKFPLTKSAYSQPECLLLLRSIGMKHKVEQISWNDMLERAETVSILTFDKETLDNLVKAILQILDLLLELNESSTVFKKSTFTEIREKFVTIPFLTLLKKPSNYPLKWKGDDLDEVTLIRPEDAYPPEATNLISGVRALIDKSLFPAGKRVLEFLLLTPELCEPSIEDVLEQLDAIIEDPSIDSIIHSSFQDSLKNICYEIYDFLQKQHKFNTSDKKQIIIDALRSKPFILTPDRFLKPNKLAFNFLLSNCSPYLFIVPDSLKRNVYDLFKTIGVRDNFEAFDYVKALQTMKTTFGEESLDRIQLKKAIQLVNCLNDCMTEEHTLIESIVSAHGPIFIPDATDKLKSASDLCYNEPECQWLPTNDIISFSHSLIPFTISKQLGVNTNREETLKKHSTGIPFGQQEKLTNRIRNILSGYPCDKEILKELLQNADDSGATEISFIKDNRQHSVERIFDKSWKPLQGPALCVYNNKAFSEDDLEAIQKLGEGSKRNDPNKTGQYGVGFNCVYHLTDVPSFLTKCSGTPATLCIFDPHAKYVPDSTLQMPGRRYQDIEDLKQLFPDVFLCYLEDKFNMNDGTMFRLPLRNEEMSRTSDLSDKVITTEFIDILFKKFSVEIVDCMLFLKNIKKISLFEIDRITGKLITLSVMESSMNKSDDIDKNKFSEVLNSSSKFIKAGNLLKIPKIITSYMIKINNNKGDWEKWLVTQTLGFDKDVKVPEEIMDAFRNKELMLMPQGGVAVFLDGNNFKVSRKRPKKLFCFLPLPLLSQFQVNINGHFALDYETRRNLWYDEQEVSVKTEWNKFLFSNVISSAYVAMLERLTSMVDDYIQPYDDSVTLIDIDYYNSIFPLFKEDTSLYWKSCATSVYKTIFKLKSNIIPYSNIQLNSYTTNDGYLMEEEKYSIKWFSLNNHNHVKPVFDDLDQNFSNDQSPTKKISKSNISSMKNETLRKILLKLNFPLIRANMQIYQCFLNSGVEVETVTPISVMNYFNLCGPTFTKCHLNNLPQALSNTPFNNKQELKTLLQYCLTDKTFFCANIEVLPLNLTADNFLRTFSLNNPVYISKYSNLFSQLGYRFIDLSILDELLPLSYELRSNIFLKLSIKEFSSLLPIVLPENKFNNQEYIINDNFNFSISLSLEWFSSVWLYIKDECKDFEDKDDIKNHLKTIENWCLLPVCINKSNNSNGPSANSSKLLFSLKNVHFVFDFTMTSLMNSPLKNCLRNLYVPEIDKDFFNKELSSFVEKIVSNLDDPSSVAEALTFALENFNSLISINECLVLIKYFSDSIDIWKDDFNTISLIRNLPIYITTEDRLTALLDYEVYVLLDEVPHMSLDTWNNERLIFLKSNVNFIDLYKTLKCQLITSSKLYLNFILRNFHFINSYNWLEHLKYIKDKILNDDNNEDRINIIDLLKTLNFIVLEDELGSNYYPASHFFDPRNQLFKIMFSNNDHSIFPPPPFGEYKWVDFMKLVGLQSSLNKELFLKFALEIEQEAYTDLNDKTIEKSKILVLNLFNSSFLSDENFLNKMSAVRFLPSSRVKSVYKSIYPAYDEKQNSTENNTTFMAFEEGIIEQHEALVWSVSYMLPDWANPFKMVGRYMNPELEGYEDVNLIKMVVGNHLKVDRKPSLNLVIKHLNNICSGAIEENNNAEYKAYMRIDILKKVYGYLQEVISKDNFNEQIEIKEQIYHLSNTPCIISNMGQSFVCPQQIVIDLYQGDQIINYLHKIPLELGEFKQLFLELGATLNATEKQYSVVLEKIYLTAPSTRLHPNELKKVLKAVHGLFSILFNNKKGQSTIKNVHKLYLPTKNGFLLESSTIIYNDEPSWIERIKHLKENFLINLDECKLDSEHHLEMINLLPTNLKPKMLSKVISEKLEDEFHDGRCMHDVANKLKCQLNTRAFALGLARLIKHEHRKIGHRIKHEVFDLIQQQLKGINVYGIEKVKNYLVYQDSRLPESEIENQCFVDKIIDSESGEIFWEIYIDKSLKLDDELQVNISEIVNKITGSLLQKNIHYIQPILSCPPHSISKVLDRLKIRPDRSNKNDLLTSTLPTAGSFIPIEDHHLLKEDFGVFEAGEYVGYEINDEMTGEATFIYAIIHSRIGDEYSPKKPTLSRNNSNTNKNDKKIRIENTKKLLMQIYKINIGDERMFIEVPAADLYKFHRVDRYVGRDSNNSETLSNFKSPIGLSKSPNFGLDSKSPFYEPINYNQSSTSNALVPVSTKQRMTEQSLRNGKLKKKNDNLDYDSVFHRQDSRVSDNSTSQDSDKASSHSGEQDDMTDKTPKIKKKASNVEDEEEILSKEQIMEEISTTLEEAWKLPEGQRRKIIKRLYLKWHPDKNPDNEKVATSLTQHIQAELERLELGLGRAKDYKGFQQTFQADPRNPFSKSASFKENFYRSYHKFFDEMNRRAKEHKEQKERYKENFSREYRFFNESKNFNFDVPPTFASTNPQPAQARKFLKQAEEDLKAADNDFNSPTNPAYEWVCIKAHQAAEKALKAAQYFVDASTSFSHDLVALVSSLEDVELRKLAVELQRVVGNSNKLYNPDPIDFVVIPHEEYTMNIAESAMKLSASILEKVAFMIDGKD